MRLKSITIEGFRAFGRLASFDLDADVIILQGANGVGKTSLLDAVLWALAGKIARFEDRGSPVSLYAREGHARVELTLSAANGDISIVRASDGSKTSVRLRADGAETEGAVAEQQLCKLLLPHLEERGTPSEVLSTVLTRGVYLQQDLVRQFIEGDSAADRFALVSEVIGAGVVLELQKSLENSRNLWSRNTSTLRKDEIDPMRARIAQLDEQLARLAEGGAIASGDAQEVSESVFRQAVALLGQSRLATGEPPSTPGRLDRFLKELAAERARLDREIATTHDLIDQLVQLAVETVPAADRGELLEQQEQALLAAISTADDDLRREIDRLAQEREAEVAAADRANRTATMARLALEDLGEHCPVCQQTHDQAHTISHLHDLIEAASQPLSAARREDYLRPLNTARAELQQRLEKVRAESRDLLNAQQQRESRQATLAARLKDLGIDLADDARAHLTDRSNAALEILARLDQLIAEGEQLSLSVLRIGEQRQRDELTVEKTALTGRLANAVSVAEGQDRTHVLAGTIIDALRDASLTVTQGQVAQIAPLFQEIYSRIDPHPTFRVTEITAGMERRQGRLHLGILDPDTSSEPRDAGPLLSSSQLNSYAVSLFLAMNLALPTLKLKVTVLDDPLQSLDSINLLGLVDVLRRFRSHRQIVVSTHEDRLMGLLQRKLRPVRAGERMINVLFEDWSRDGPTFQTIRSEYSNEVDSVLAA